MEERHSHQGQPGFTATAAANPGAAPRHHRFRTHAQIAWWLQEARSAPYSARQDRGGRQLVARRPLVRGGGPRGHARARRHRLRLRCGHARWASLWQGGGLQRPGVRHPARARSSASACRDDRARSADRRLRAPRPDQPLSVIATPTEAIRIKRPAAAPTGIDWTRLSAEDLEEMPILAELKRMTIHNA